MKSRKTATLLKNLIVSQRRLKKVSYPAHIPYPQHHELASKFPSNTNKYDVFIPRNFALLVISGMRLKNMRMQKIPCCIKKFAVTEVDPCGGVEKHPTGVWYETDKYCP